MTRFVLALGLGWLIVVVAWPNAVWALCFDDSFYYFQLARNVAAGHGTTFDRINPTNGFHPLWAAVCVPLYSVGLDGLTAVRVALAGQVVLWTGALLLLTKHLRLQGAVVGAVLGLAAAGPAVVKTFVNGMESGLVLPLHAALLVQRSDTRAQRLVLATLGSLAFLARTDAGFLLLWMGVWNVRRPFRELVEMFLLPGLVIVGFCTFNQLRYGSPVQVSGLLKFSAPTPIRMIWIAACLSLPFLVRRSRMTAFPRLHEFLREKGWYVGFTCTVLAWYTGIQVFPRLWYFAPNVLLAIAIVGLGLSDLLDLAQRQGSARTLGALLVVPLSCAFGVQWLQAVDPRGSAVMRGDAEAAEWIGANLPVDTVLGSWDAGVIGYFARQRIINLDGVVNSIDYMRASRDGTAPALLRSQGLEWVVNHDTTTTGTLVAVTRETTGRDAELVKQWDYAFAGSSNRDAVGVHAMATFLYALR